jgi:hypothetical protein
MYDPTAASLWNTIFTALPVILVSVFNLDYSVTAALWYPQVCFSGDVIIDPQTLSERVSESVSMRVVRM